MSFTIGNAILHSSLWQAKPVKEELRTLHPYRTVHQTDQLPVNIIDPSLKKGPWIAGGACLRWFQNTPVDKSDIDVFCRNELQATMLIEHINHIGLSNYSNGYSTEVIKTDNACTFKINANGQEWKIQVITCKYFNTIQDVIDHFDISVCQVATTGNEWILGEKTAKDIHERNLRFNRINKHAPKRLIKYWIYGFNPVPGTIEEIQRNTDISWDYANDEEYSNVI